MSNNNTGSMYRVCRLFGGPAHGRTMGVENSLNEVYILEADQEVVSFKSEDFSIPNSNPGYHRHVYERDGAYSFRFKE